MTRHAIPVALALLLGACASVPDSAGVRVPQSPLEMRQAQSRTFETADTRLVLKAALNVLQDQGFVIRHADAELGIVTAVMEWRSRHAEPGPARPEVGHRRPDLRRLAAHPERHGPRSPRSRPT